MMKGYKAFRKGLVTQFDTVLEVGETYKIDSQIEWNKNGYHFCANPEDTLRYIRDFNEETVVAEVYTDGNYDSYEDDYNGYYDMYVSDQITVDRVLSREELFNLIFNRGEYSILKMIQNYRLTEEEINRIKGKSISIDEYIEYYQFHNKDAFSKRLRH